MNDRDMATVSGVLSEGGWDDDSDKPRLAVRTVDDRIIRLDMGAESIARDFEPGEEVIVKGVMIEEDGRPALQVQSIDRGDDWDAGYDSDEPGRDVKVNRGGPDKEFGSRPKAGKKPRRGGRDKYWFEEN